MLVALDNSLGTKHGPRLLGRRKVFAICAPAGRNNRSNAGLVWLANQVIADIGRAGKRQAFVVRAAGHNVGWVRGFGVTGKAAFQRLRGQRQRWLC